MNPKAIFLSFIFCLSSLLIWGQTPIFDRFEYVFQSSKVYKDPIYEVENFQVSFQSPSGKEKTVRGFWDGGTVWKVRFMPDEMGTWTFLSSSSDPQNAGLHGIEGSFECVASNSDLGLYKNGSIVHFPGSYQLSHQDGTPFFWTACTAWNGALKASPEEWEYYLDNRKSHGYNTIQLVTTQWRGSETNQEGEVAFTGAGHIQINPEFFKRIDERIDAVNKNGLLASPVVLWALPFGNGNEFSPGYYLPIKEAVILAKYIVARYQGNHVVWNLGGDGKYYGDLEDRWKSIGQQVFGEGKHQGLVTLHPHGLSWVGEIYEDEPWYDLYTYQSSHSKTEGTVRWINEGPVSKEWAKLKPLPLINTEPLYEDIREDATPQDIRNAWYWSVFSAPIAGITYGANGIWPWLREGEEIQNHGSSAHVTRWKKSLELPGSIQMGYLHEFFTSMEWWKLKPAADLLVYQPGDDNFNHFVSVIANEERSQIVVYMPVKDKVQLYNSKSELFNSKWFNPVSNTYEKAEISYTEHGILIENKKDQDMVLVLDKVTGN